MDMEKLEAETMEKKEPNYRGIKAMPFVIGNETFEKLGTLGTSANLLVYLTSVFKMSSMGATTLLNIFNGTCNFGALVGAFLSDSYFGRYKTLGFSSVSSFLGMLVLALTAAIKKLHPPSCADGDHSSRCAGPTAGQLAFLLGGFGLLVVGASGIRPCNLAFGADQFNPNTESGRRGITSFFNWYYFTFTFSVMVSMTIIVYVQSNISWAIGLGIPTALMLGSCILFFAGTKIYVKVMPTSSPFTGVAQVIVAAFRKRKLNLSDQPVSSLYNYISTDTINSKLPHTNQFRFLDKGATLTSDDRINTDGSAANPWRLCSLQQVEEVKCLLRLVPIWLAALIHQMSLVQLQNYVVFQALQSDRHLVRNGFQIPAATYNVFLMLALTIWLPIYDRIVIPVLRKYTKNEDGITLLQRLCIGIILAIFAMVISGLVEMERRTIALTKPTLGKAPQGDIAAMSALWLIPQLAVMGIGDGFGYIAVNELFYKQCPENMRSIAASLVLCAVAGASYSSTLVTSIVQRATGGGGRQGWLGQDLNKGRLDYFYYLIAVLEFLNLIYFLMCAKWYKYKGTDGTTVDVAIAEIEAGNPPIDSRYFVDQRKSVT